MSDEQKMSLAEYCNTTREDLKDLERRMRAFLEDEDFEKSEQTFPGQHGEMKAQAKLAIRAIEEARMRCGKVLQYMGDGVSIYDKVNKA